jgi:hypothetical protein
VVKAGGFATAILGPDRLARGVDLRSLENGLQFDTLNVGAYGDGGDGVTTRWGSMLALTAASDAGALFMSTYGLMYHSGTTIVSPSGGTVATGLATNSASRPVQFAEYNGNVFVTDPDGTGLRYWRGITSGPLLSIPALAGISVKSIGVWQNRVWVGTDNERVYWSGPGQETDWDTVNDWTMIRVGNDLTDISALGFSTSVPDVVGRVGMLAFKTGSCYRVVDSNTGEHLLMDPRVGVSYGHQVAYSGDLVVAINEQGVWAQTLSNPAPFDHVSGPVQPLLVQAGFSRLKAVAIYNADADTFLFANGTTTIFEWNPRTKGWWLHSLNDAGTPRSFVAAAAGTPTGWQAPLTPPFLLADDKRKIINLGYRTDASAAFGQADFTNNAGVAGSPFTQRIATPWVTFASDKARVRRAILEGLTDGAAAVTLSLRRNFDLTLEPRSPLTSAWTPAGSSQWGRFAEVHSLGVARALALVISRAGGTLRQTVAGNVVVYQPPLRMHSARFDYVPLGRA